MTDESPLVTVRAAPEFQKRLRQLAKRYRQIRDDIQPVLKQLQFGDFIGDQIAGTGCTVFKIRVKNSDIQKGKRAGYRLIYQVESPISVRLLLIYAKSDQDDVSADEIKLAIAEADDSD